MSYTLHTYGSLNYRASSTRAGNLAERRVGEDRRCSGRDHPQAVGKSQGKQRRSLVHETGRRCARATKPVEQKGLLAALKGVADTGFLVAFANRTDRYCE